MDIPKIPLADFKENIDRLLTAVITKGYDSMESLDLGDLIGHLIICDNLEEATELYEEFCSGMHHGIGLSNKEPNSAADVEAFITRWAQK
ncbi:hypothetical protein [Endozoicomonas sp. SCSIO W0465]|uniref:hypothetical protein n=1 Tax=Endozoicomonas sp. SCSIO W0465 TaxID=2918516 RepID=UPI0020757FEC|nr:hypothetical protein [Endozoicomonas sp. SCSIO W0465]USE38715.1 hypothetical protein MJO57_11395 [Endozoicomonas sp. SCSIO W0465]